MATFDFRELPDGQLLNRKWALLHASARVEAAGRPPERLTEPLVGTWAHFRGRMTGADFAALLFEDAAVLHPIAFGALGEPIKSDAPDAGGDQHDNDR